MIEAFLAAFLSFAPPAEAAQRCDDYSSIRPGCNVNTGGGRESKGRPDKGDKGGGKGKGKK